MKENLMTVLVVEDLGAIQLAIKVSVKDKVNLLQAYTKKEAEDFFERKKEQLAFIFLDGCLQSSYTLTTDSFIRNTKADPLFKGKIIAISSRHNQTMMELGCDDACEKWDVADYIKAELKKVQNNIEIETTV